MNQIELHPYFTQTKQREYNRSLGIVTESWSPLAEGRDLGRSRAIREIAQAHAVTPSQAALRWNIQLGAIPVPRSANAARQRENLDVFEFALSEDEMSAIGTLDSGRLWGADPDSYESF